MPVDTKFEKETQFCLPNTRQEKYFRKKILGGREWPSNLGVYQKIFFRRIILQIKKFHSSTIPLAHSVVKKNLLQFGTTWGARSPYHPKKMTIFAVFTVFRPDFGEPLRNPLEVVIELSIAVSTHFKQSKSVHK
jgi:hypothetical protein